MEMTPLALVILLAFGLILAASLTVWTAVRAGTSQADDEEGIEGASSGSGRLRGRQQRGQSREQGRESGREQQHGQERQQGRGQGTEQRRERQRGQERGADEKPVPAREGPAVDEVAGLEGEEPDGRGVAGKSTGRGGEVDGRSSRGDSRNSRGNNSGGRSKRGESDAFERFLEARPDDMDFG